MSNFVVALIILVIMSLSIAKIVIEKKNGAKCIGCPHGGSVKSKNSGCSCSEPSGVKLKMK